jgi:hypothetical protein
VSKLTLNLVGISVVVTRFVSFLCDRLFISHTTLTYRIACASSHGLTGSDDHDVPGDSAAVERSSSTEDTTADYSNSPPPAIDATAQDLGRIGRSSTTAPTLSASRQSTEATSSTGTTTAVTGAAAATAIDRPAAVAPPSRSRNQSPNRAIQRRQSMPEMRIDPPIYQIDDDYNIKYHGGKLPDAREDEGHEDLPGYSCEVHIEGYVPRKMEFTKPGVQAKDRRWKRQYIILHGTSIKIYKSDPRLKAVPGEAPPPTPGIYTDKYRPSFSSGTSGRSSTINRHLAQAQKTGASAVTTRMRAPTESSISSMSSQSSVESEKALMWNKAVQDAFAAKKYDPDMPVHVHLQEEDEHGLASLQHAPSALLAKASENRCIRHYTLQGI